MKTVILNSKAQKLAEKYIRQLEKDDFPKRLWAKDPSIWKTEAEHQKIIANSLGWLRIPAKMLQQLNELETFANGIKKDFDHCVVLGMGGSSLAPEVFRRLFPVKPGYLRLHVLDSTDPDRIAAITAGLNLKKTFFIFSSKSGGTVEPNSLFAYFYAEVKKISANPSAHFAAITDSGTSLEKLGANLGFRKVFINPSDIGGRFSALSFFGLVPAALMGLDLRKLLDRCLSMAEACSPLSAINNNEGVILGAAMGACALNAMDKATFLMPADMQPFGLWLEQLIAESTGKEGKGIIPVAGEKLHSRYGRDRFFVQLKPEGFAGDEAGIAVKKLEQSDYPVITVIMKDIYDLGAQFFLWEIATAAAGALLKINPFDQPDVQESKTITRNILAGLSKNARLQQDGGDGKIAIIASKALAGKNFSAGTFIHEISSVAGKNDYIALLAYLDGSQQADNLLRLMRNSISDKTGAATIASYGPRYLHSTGQLYKGGANNGIFIIISAAPQQDVKIPGQNYSFGGLIRAQAEGDFKALESKGRRAVFIHLPKPAAKSLKTLIEYISGGMKMPKIAVKKTVKTKAADKTTDYIVIDHPKNNEAVPRTRYTFRIGSSPCEKVEVSIDDQPWYACRHSVGYWWYDWSGYNPGTHQIVARLYKNGNTLVSRRRRFKVS